MVELKEKLWDLHWVDEMGGWLAAEKAYYLVGLRAKYMVAMLGIPMVIATVLLWEPMTGLQSVDY